MCHACDTRQYLRATHPRKQRHSPVSWLSLRSSSWRTGRSPSSEGIAPAKPSLERVIISELAYIHPRMTRCRTTLRQSSCRQDVARSRVLVTVVDSVIRADGSGDVGQSLHPPRGDIVVHLQSNHRLYTVFSPLHNWRTKLAATLCCTAVIQKLWNTGTMCIAVMFSRCCLYNTCVHGDWGDRELRLEFGRAKYPNSNQ